MRHEWDRYYSTAVWRRHRRDQLRKQPLCEACLAQGFIKHAKVVHHTTPHKGDWVLFCSRELESLCKSCHDQHTASVERAGIPIKPRIALDGWPEERNEQQ